jgi:hypothetical protein
VVHGGLLEKSPNALAFNRILPRTTLLQSEGTPMFMLQALLQSSFIFVNRR